MEDENGKKRRIPIIRKIVRKTPNGGEIKTFVDVTTNENGESHIFISQTRHGGAKMKIGITESELSKIQYFIKLSKGE